MPWNIFGRRENRTIMSLITIACFGNVNGLNKIDKSDNSWVNHFQKDIYSIRISANTRTKQLFITFRAQPFSVRRVKEM